MQLKITNNGKQNYSKICLEKSVHYMIRLQEQSLVILINSSIGPKIIRGINIIAPTINTVINKKKLSSRLDWFGFSLSYIYRVTPKVLRKIQPLLHVINDMNLKK